MHARDETREREERTLVDEHPQVPENEPTDDLAEKVGQPTQPGFEPRSFFRCEVRVRSVERCERAEMEI
jgi:hypothetical protein